MALGGAGRAGPLLNDSIFLNPAYTALQPTNSFAFNWLTYRSNDQETARGRNYAVAIQDGRNEYAQAGISYSLREDASFIHAGLARSLVERLGFGIAGKHVMDPVRQTNTQEAVLAMAAVPINWFQMSFVIDNLFESDLGKAHGMFRDVALGLKFNVQSIVLAYIDPQVTPSLGRPFGYSAGLEFVLMQDLFLRWGRFQNVNVPYLAQRGTGYGLGFGWIAPRMSLDYGLTRSFEPLATTAHSFSATLYF